MYTSPEYSCYISLGKPDMPHSGVSSHEGLREPSSTIQHCTASRAYQTHLNPTHCATGRIQVSSTSCAVLYCAKEPSKPHNHCMVINLYELQYMAGNSLICVHSVQMEHCSHLQSQFRKNFHYSIPPVHISVNLYRLPFWSQQPYKERQLCSRCCFHVKGVIQVELLTNHFN